MENLTPSWVSFHFCIHHHKLIVASISSKVRISSVKLLSEFCLLIKSNTLENKCINIAAGTYQGLLLILVVISSNSPSVVFQGTPWIAFHLSCKGRYLKGLTPHDRCIVAVSVSRVGSHPECQDPCLLI